jgi:hypothetical protein
MYKAGARRLSRFSIALSLFAFAFPAIAQRPEIVRESRNGTSIHFQLQVPAAGFSVAITGPDDFALTRSFIGHDGSVNLLEAGQSIADGGYVYEVRVEPVIDAYTRAALKQSREENNPTIVRELKRMGKIPSEPQVKSTGFSVLNGAIVQPDGIEETSANIVAPPPPSIVRRRITRNDQVIPDDMIVQQSLCVGFDCVDGESFGTDTIRLKENNLRIKFDDTSTSAGYAANDWELFANDQPSGGANRFSINDSTAGKSPFTVAAGARENALYLRSGDHVGFGTAAPDVDLHTVSTDTPVLRLQQTNGGGFTAQTWDVGGNEANFWVRDITGGSLLSFRIRPGAPTSSIDILSDGRIGFGRQVEQMEDGARIHAYANSGAMKLLLEEGNATSTTRTLLDLKNNGRAGITLRDSSGTANYAITGPGTSSNTLAISNSVDTTATKVLIGGTGTTTHTLDVQGTLRVTGNITSASTKAGIIAPASFVNGVAEVTFVAPFPDTNYAIALTAVTTDGRSIPLGVMTKSATGFKVKRIVTPELTGPPGLPGSGTTGPDPLLEINWTALVISG